MRPGPAFGGRTKSITEWIGGVFDEVHVWNGAAVRDKVTKPRMVEVERIKKEPFKWNKFQDDCADTARLPDRALLLAPCGSGKTLAAWRWIEERAKRRIGHVLFLYPTRATATEGFRDYVSWAPEAEAALMHGTSGFDLEGMFANPPECDYRKGRTFTLSEADQRMFALGYWGRRAFSATVDQFLAFLQYGYGPVCMLPVLADSVVVIDEVHSFDRNMFSALKKFLTDFDVPVLCMTATLPKNRYAELTEPVDADGCGLTPYEERPGDLATIAAVKRYRVRRVTSAEEAEQAVRDALKANKRVLWVVNQVKRAQQHRRPVRADAARAFAGHQPPHAGRRTGALLPQSIPPHGSCRSSQGRDAGVEGRTRPGAWRNDAGLRDEPGY